MCGVGRHSAGDEDEGGEDVVWVPIPASHVTGEIPRLDLTGDIPIIQLTGEFPKVSADVVDTEPTGPAAGSTAVLPEPPANPYVDSADLDTASSTPTRSAEGAKQVTVVVDPHTSSTRADMNLLKAMPGLRARALAGVVVPFLLYTVLMIVIGRMDIYVIWVWIPTVVAGVLVGHFLDVAHSRVRQTPATTSSDASN
jgi:hypothetical protein